MELIGTRSRRDWKRLKGRFGGMKGLEEDLKGFRRGGGVEGGLRKVCKDAKGGGKGLERSWDGRAGE